MDGARLLLVDDDDTFRTVVARQIARAGHEVETAATGTAALEALARSEPEVVLLDLRLPDLDGMEVLERIRREHPTVEVIVLTGHGAVDTAIRAVRLGAYDYLEKPSPVAVLDVAVRKAREHRSLLESNVILRSGLTPPDRGAEFCGKSPAFQELVRLIERVAQTDSSVLVVGETGVGKSAVAQLIHSRSPRKAQPFVVVDCGALHDTLLQNELFGHERGAFTGAGSLTHGLFEVASRGTIFLDEIGDVSAATQAQLLRVLETGKFRRVGGTKEVQVDVRVIAATNRDLNDLLGRGTFRKDLYFRLHAIQVEIPPLRERREDVAVLVEHVTRRYNARCQQERRFSDTAIRALEQYRWPGNVRELIHEVETAMTLCDGSIIGPEKLSSTVRGARSGGWMPEGDQLVTLREAEKRYIDHVLQKVNGHRGRAADVLGISERNLYRRLVDKDED